MAIRDLIEHPLPSVTVRELADYWLVSQQLIRKHVAAGRLHCLRLGPRPYRVTVVSALALERQSATSDGQVKR